MGLDPEFLSRLQFAWVVGWHILVAIRLVNRLLNPAPRLPQGMPAWQRFAAHASHFVLYALMFALPLDLTRIGALEPDVGDRQEPGWTEREEEG